MISHKPKKERVGKKATDTSCSISLQKKKIILRSTDKIQQLHG